jgi:hypothetical protein
MVAAHEDDNLTDNDLQSEIELVGDLVVAASASEGPLPQDEVDLLLGLRPCGPHLLALGPGAGAAPEPESEAEGQTSPR